MMELTKTPKQVEREVRNEQIVKKFKELREAYPHASINRLCDTISQHITGLTSAGVRFVLVQLGEI